MLEDLAKKDKQWRKMALYICNDKEQADDLVQEMYLYFADKKGVYNDSYVYFALKDLFLMTKSKRYINNRIEFHQLNNNIDFELPDYDYEQDLKIQNDIDLINDTLNQSRIEKIIINGIVFDGLRKFSRESGISINTAQKWKNKFKDKIWQKRNKAD
jgi:N-acetylneuraminic acid mutarotase